MDMEVILTTFSCVNILRSLVFYAKKVSYLRFPKSYKDTIFALFHFENKGDTIISSFSAHNICNIFS